MTNFVFLTCETLQSDSRLNRVHYMFLNFLWNNRDHFLRVKRKKKNLLVMKIFLYGLWPSSSKAMCKFTTGRRDEKVIASRHSVVASLLCMHSESHEVIDTINLNPPPKIKIIAFLSLDTGVPSNTLRYINHKIF